MSSPHRTRRFLPILVVVLPLLAASASAQIDPRSPLVAWPAGVHQPLPDLDVRLTDDGRPALDEANAELRTRASIAARDADEKALKSSIPFLRIDHDSVFGTPRWVASIARCLTRPVDGPFDAPDVVRGFVQAHRGLFELAPEDLLRARKTRDFVTPSTRTRHLTFQQTVGGVDLEGAKLRANVTRKGELVNVSSTMLPIPEGGLAPSPVRIGELQAMRLAASSIGATWTRDPAPLATPSAARNGASQKRAWAGSPDFREDKPISTELVYFPRTRAEIRAAWKIVLPERGIGNDYEVLVDATDGTILRRQSRVLFFADPPAAALSAARAPAAAGTQDDVTFRVYTKNSPGPGYLNVPNGFQFPVVGRDLLTVTMADIPESPDGWIPSGANETLGNNVDAHTDLNADNQPDLPRPHGSPFRVFDFPQDNTTEPYNWRDASVANLFYYCNRYHDLLYDLGFDEAAGNFQNVNFTGEGLGGDALQADCQDGSGYNNANFIPDYDGASGRMQMFLWNGPDPMRDGSLDSDIVYHEFTHGVSSRLHDLEIYGAQAGGMGEGWSDYVAVSLNADPTDDPNAVHNVGGYTTFEAGLGFVDNYYYGVRRFPFSTDLSKNPMTYADIDPQQQSYPAGTPRNPYVGVTANEPHNVGVLWANILLDARARMWAMQGFAANENLLQLVIEGMKLDPGTPDFLEARDAILQADMVANGSIDYPYLWPAFANRGCGWNAVSPGGDTSTGIRESYDLPISFVYPTEGVPQTLAPNQGAQFSVTITGADGLSPALGTQTLWLSLNGAPYVPTALVPTSQTTFDVTIPAGQCFDVMTWYLSVDTNYGTSTSPGDAPGEVFTTQVILGTTGLFDDNFQNDLGWTTASANANSGLWQRGVPVNDPNWAYGPISDADGSGKCYVTGNVPGNSDVDGGPDGASVILTSPVFDMTGGADVSYAYYLYLTDETGSDRLEFKMNDGSGHWKSVRVHTTSASSTWRTVTVTAEEIQALGLAFTPNMQLRFVATDAPPATVVEAGVDAVHVRRRLCSDPVGTPFCAGDGSVIDCPCGNVGHPGHGCDNSVGTGGARLDAAGTTNPDTVTLLVTGELPSVLTLFVQADTVVSPVHFGDGLRCVGGTLKRLYAKSASMGLASAPVLGDLPITARSAALGDPIGAGETRHYFAYYRDPSGTFCPPPSGATFNATNAFSIVW